MENTFFPEIKGNFGFGIMRLPMKGDLVDLEQTQQMADEYFAAGFNYVDTAHVYHSGQSETAIRDTISKRRPRESFVLTNKLSGMCFSKTEEIAPLFETQLEACGVEYFDFYLMHAQEAASYKKFRDLRAYETALKFKEDGRIRHFGISFHDNAKLLDEILTEYPQIELVQIQFNYLDYDDPSVESRKCYDVCVKHNKPVSVMEPIKGGNLINLPPDAQSILDELSANQDPKPSNASYALRFAASFPQMCVVLSGMSALDQMRDNLSFMRDFRPFDEEEYAAVRKVADVFHSKSLIPCTGCRYCVDGCPKKLRIPEYFSAYNTFHLFNDPMTKVFYQYVLTSNGVRASSCIKCGKCEKACPQHLKIRDFLGEVVKTLEDEEATIA